MATSEDLHIERKDAHQLDTTARRLPDANPDKVALQAITFLEAYATAYRYPTPTGRTPAAPPAQLIASALDDVDSLLAILTRHFGVDLDSDAPAIQITPRR